MYVPPGVGAADSVGDGLGDGDGLGLSVGDGLGLVVGDGARVNVGDGEGVGPAPNSEERTSVPSRTAIAVAVTAMPSRNATTVLAFTPPMI
jgi:hypothetical protein